MKHYVFSTKMNNEKFLHHMRKHIRNVVKEHGTTRLQFATYDVVTRRKIGECFR